MYISNIHISWRHNINADSNNTDNIDLKQITTFFFT